MEGIRPEFGALFGLEKSSRAEENLLTWIRLFFAISLVSLVRYARARSWVMSNVRRTFRVRIPLQDGLAAIYSASSIVYRAVSERMTTHHTFSLGRSGHHARAQDVDKVALYLIGDRKS
jgi:hypothetical protein